VCDAYDAMCSDRVYRRALSWPEIKAELERGRGTQWDSRVVDAWIATLEAERRERTQRPITARAAGHEQLALATPDLIAPGAER
jgi:HD-GYP domain-containing protein (c-di-GMP phosphodiesterase class II)